MREECGAVGREYPHRKEKTRFVLYRLDRNAKMLRAHRASVLKWWTEGLETDVVAWNPRHRVAALGLGDGSVP